MTNNPVTPVTESAPNPTNGTQRTEGNPQPGNQQQAISPPPTDPRPTGTERVAAARDSEAVVPPPVTTSTNPAWLSLDGAEDRLVDLLMELNQSNAAAVKDTATAYYNATGISDRDRATAAYVTANAFSSLDDRLSALDWARRALQLDPNNRSYRQLVNDLESGAGS
jgi:hypothetical protein